MKKKKEKGVEKEMTIKNPHIIHYPLKGSGRLKYLCIQACGVTSEKLTAMKEKVTCKNCKRILKKQGLKKK